MLRRQLRRQLMILLSITHTLVFQFGEISFSIALYDCGNPMASNATFRSYFIVVCVIFSRVWFFSKST